MEGKGTSGTQARWDSHVREDTARAALCARGERPREKANLLTPDFGLRTSRTVRK